MVRSQQAPGRKARGSAAIGGRGLAHALAAGLLALWAGAGGCAHLWPPWPFAADASFTVARSARFVAHAVGDPPTPSIEALEQAATLLEASLFPGRSIAQVEVLMFDWPEFRRLLGRNRTGASIAELPGKGPGGKSGLLVVYRQDATSAGALHRLAHLYLHSAAPRAPLWLHEGLASYLETAEVRGEDRDQVACLGQLPRKDAELTLVDLFALSFASFDEAQGSPVRFTAGSVIDYFMLGEGGKLRGKLSDLIARLGEGLATEAALEAVYPGLTVAALQEKVTAHRRASETGPRGRCPVAFRIKLEPVAPPKLDPPGPGTTEALLARLRMLPRRAGRGDWFPPEMTGLEGAQLSQKAAGR
jgi:hypothetical protein